jgi:ABC-2 type transport system permease protein
MSVHGRSETLTPGPDAQGRADSARGRFDAILRWSVRRELWEHRSVTVVPLVVAGLGLLAFLLASARIASSAHPFADLVPEQQAALLEKPYPFVVLAVLVSALLVAIFYCLGALHGERRDRSILFWKSLPVSDVATVLAKAGIPLVVLPSIAFVLVAALQWTMLCVSSAVLLLHGQPLEPLWETVPLGRTMLQEAWGLFASALWLAPVYGWLLLASAFAQRTTLLWAVLPWILLSFFEHIAFETSVVGMVVRNRLGGFLREAYTRGDGGAGGFGAGLHADPVGFFGSPGVWAGLVFAAACLYGAAWLRRRHGPV